MVFAGSRTQNPPWATTCEFKVTSIRVSGRAVRGQFQRDTSQTQAPDRPRRCAMISRQPVRLYGAGDYCGAINRRWRAIRRKRYEALEERDVKYAIRLPANDNLERDIAELLTRPVGRPSYKPLVWFKSFLYQAVSWKTARRVVAKVEFHFGELFPRVGFIVTNLGTSSRAVVRFYNKRGTAEQWIKEGKQAVKMTRLSCHRFRSNQVRLWLSLTAYNLGNLCRRLALPARVDSWSLTSLQQRLVKTGGRMIKHARYYWLLLAEGHLTRRLFAGMLRKIAALPLPAG